MSNPFPTIWLVRRKDWPEGQWEPIKSEEAPKWAEKAFRLGGPIETSKANSLLAQLQIASCTCVTKTPEIQFHQETCRYRQLSELGTLLGLHSYISGQQS